MYYGFYLCQLRTPLQGGDYSGEGRWGGAGAGAGAGEAGGVVVHLGLIGRCRIDGVLLLYRYRVGGFYSYLGTGLEGYRVRPVR
jgi:hypothetical protein